jgi:Leucine-rich repeat (LRR) protein
LDIYYNDIGEKGIGILAKMSNLTELNVSSNKIGKNGLETLMRNSTFTYLDISYNTGSKNVIGESEKLWNRKAEQAKGYSRLAQLSNENRFLGLPSELEKLILGYCEPDPFTFYNDF